MISVTAFRVRNLRSLEDSGYIELKPITILVGRNSSGKSTLARVFPLLRQSAEATKRGPILWWGRLVDFGSFDEALNRYAKESSIGLDFKISFDADDLKATTRRALGRLSILRLLRAGVIEVSLQFKKAESGPYTSNISISVFDFQCKLSLNEHGMVTAIDSGTYSWRPSGQVICYAPQDRLMPNPAFFKEAEAAGGRGWESFDPFKTDLPRSVKPFVHGNTAEDRVRQLANKIPLGPRAAVFEQLLLITNPQSFRETLIHVGHNSREFIRLCDLSFVSQLDVLIDQINNAITAFSSEVIYLEPLRATAQRYYRQQALAVGEIDSKGENIAMFLDSLPTTQLTGFQQWTSKHFGIKVAPKKEGGHISLTVTQIAGGAEANIADMGFGFSQMLPIAAQLWAASAARAFFLPNRRKSHQSLIVIEQPELHLHPDYQAKLADVFVAGVSEQIDVDGSSYPPPTDLRIVAETHSPALINRLGALIADKIVDRKKVQVVVFEQADSQSPSKITLAEFDDEGILQNWPFGFFEPNTAS